MARYLWVAPTSAIGLALFAVGSLAGARAVRRGGILEVEGRGIRWLLSALPVGFEVQAIALGHVVLGRDRPCLERTRAHERVHVEQAERWGPAFVPAYLIAGLLSWLRGGSAYWDNPFEREARGCESSPRPPAESRS